MNDFNLNILFTYTYEVTNIKKIFDEATTPSN